MLNELAQEIREVSASKGWDLTTVDRWSDVEHILAAVCLQHSELSEALEEARVGNLDKFLEEQADVVIRTLNLVGGLTDDFDSVVRAKIEKNRGRPHKHGGKLI